MNARFPRVKRLQLTHENELIRVIETVGCKLISRVVTRIDRNEFTIRMTFQLNDEVRSEHVTVILTIYYV